MAKNTTKNNHNKCKNEKIIFVQIVKSAKPSTAEFHIFLSTTRWAWQQNPFADTITFLKDKCLPMMAVWFKYFPSNIPNECYFFSPFSPQATDARNFLLENNEEGRWLPQRNKVSIFCGILQSLVFKWCCVFTEGIMNRVSWAMGLLRKPQAKIPKGVKYSPS